MVATWKTQAAPTFDAALQAAQQANESITSGGERMTAGLGEVLEAPEDAIMNQAKTALMGLDTDQARKDFLIQNPSSFHDADKLETFRAEMMKNDGARETERHKLSVMSQSKILDGITDPDQYLDKLNQFQRKNAFDGTDDDEGLLSARMTERLGDDVFTVSRDTIEEAHGDPDDETSLTEDVQERAFDIIDKKIRDKYFGASPDVIKKKRNEAIAASQWGPQFARRTKELGDMTTKEIQSERHAHDITKALSSTGPKAQEHLRTAVNTAVDFIQKNTTRLSDDEKAWIKKPIMEALQRENVDADARWMEINGAHGKPPGSGSPANQRRFGREMAAQYKQKYPNLSKEIIDEHLADLIKRSGLETMIGKGNMVHEFQTRTDRAFLESVTAMKGRTSNILINIAESNLASVTSDKIAEVINKTWEGSDKDGNPKIKDLVRSDLIKQSHETVKKIKSAFINAKGNSHLTRDQEATLDIAIYRFLSKTAGYDPDSGYIPWDDPDFVLSTIGGKDMSNNSIQSLLEGIKDFLPHPDDRTPGSKKDGAILLETKIATYMEREGPGDTPPPTGNVPEYYRGSPDKIAAGLKEAQNRIDIILTDPDKVVGNYKRALAKARKDKQKYINMQKGIRNRK
jgi:hypothetical protein